MTPAIRVDALRLASRAGDLVHGVSWSVAPGETLGIVGESGSGKSLSLKAVAGLLPSAVWKAGGTVTVHGRVGFVFQDPMSALDPLVRVGDQVIEICRYVRGMDKARAQTRARELFEMVGLSPDAKMRSYPHELSGGQRQRIVITLALASEPDILLCDEPTTALDVTVQAQILTLLEHLRKSLKLTLVFVSHNLAVVGRLCPRIIVMKQGRIVETGTSEQILRHPSDSYTQMLLDAMLDFPEPEALR